jgi:transposase-like protein
MEPNRAMRGKNVEFSHSLVWRWVQKYAPEINKRIRPHLKMSGTSYRVDETYIKVGKQWKYLYRALDKEGNTIEFMLSAKRNIPAAKRFFRKTISTPHTRMPSPSRKKRKYYFRPEPVRSCRIAESPAGSVMP